MTPENKQKLARGLQNNEYLGALFDDRADELREDWEATEPADAETRERVYVELRTLTQLREFIYAQISADAGDGVN